MLKELVEILFEKNLLKVLFSTETLSRALLAFCMITCACISTLTFS